MADERIRLDPSVDIPVRHALSADERTRRHGWSYPHPPHVGDVIALNHFDRNVTVTAVHGDGTVSVRPTTTCQCDDGWVCEEHPNQALEHRLTTHFPHGFIVCGGAGMPCTNPKCPYGRAALARQPIDEAITAARYPNFPDLE